jgi:tRNA pseudouridine55 synthase
MSPKAAERSSHAVRREPWLPIDGVLLLDKPLGVSSNAALQRARRAIRAAHAGHTGTLDPLASGLLPLVLGDAARFGQSMLDADKAYRATVRLGERTSTGDAEGEVVARAPVPPLDPVVIEAVLERFRGPISQIPPMHSALKRDGVPLYQLARQGQSVERPARTVTIHALALVRVDLAGFEMDVRCSKGTYIRTLAEDIGQALGTEAHLRSLRRTAVGDFDIASAVTLDEFETLEQTARLARLLPVDAPIARLPRVDLDPESARRLRHGQTVPARGAIAAGDLVRAYSPEGMFLGVVEAGAGVLRPKRLVREPAG